MVVVANGSKCHSILIRHTETIYLVQSGTKSVPVTDTSAYCDILM